MIKKFIQIILFLFILLLLFLTYLSTYGISTDKFNKLISEKIIKGDKYLEIDLDKIKIFLNIRNFNFELKTNNPKVFYKKNEIKIKSISTDLKLGNFFLNKINLKQIKIQTDTNKIKNLIEVARSYKNNTELFFLNKIIEDGLISFESKITFNEDGSLRSNYVVDGDIKNLKLKLLNNNVVENTNFSFLIKEKEYLIYNLSSLYQSIKIRSNQIKIFDNENNFVFEGDISNQKNQIDLEKFSNLMSDSFKKIINENLIIASNSKFSFKMSKKMKFSDIYFQTKLSIDKLKFSNNIFKKFFPGYKEDIKFENNSITIDFKNSDFEIIGKSMLNINGDIDNINYSLKKIEREFIYDLSFEFVNSAINFKILNYTKNKGEKSLININGKYLESKVINLKNIKFVQDKNSIDIHNVNLSKNQKIESVDELKINILNNNNKHNKLKLKKNKNQYFITSKIFDGTKLVDEILFSKKDTNFFDLFNNLNSDISIKIDTAYLNSEDYVEFLDTKLTIKNNKIFNLNLLSKFPSNDEFKVSVRTNKNEEKITTVFTNNAKPLVKKYKFIKGFDGGSLDFYSISKNNTSKSNLKLYDFKLNEVPALTKVLTLASLQGIADLLAGEGIRFNELEMKFNKNNGLMTIEEMYSLGPSISVLMEGYVQKDDLISLKGTLVPATTINKVIGSIPLLGDILVGKKAGEGVFGVSFKIKGYPKDLKTTVNPIKSLTPRFITRTLEKIKR